MQYLCWYYIANDMDFWQATRAHVVHLLFYYYSQATWIPEPPQRDTVKQETSILERASIEALKDT